MADEKELDLEQLDSDIEKDNKVEKRIKDLSEKVKLTSEERDELKVLSEEKDTKISDLEKERDFLNSFGDVLVKHPAASEFKDAIKEKVLKGYSVEDATVSTLSSEGKLTPSEPKPEEEAKPENPAGGSAITPPAPEGEKKLEDMTSEEKRAKLVEAQERGDLSIN